MENVSFLEQLWMQVTVYINIAYLFSFMLLGYLVKRYFQAWLNSLFNKEIKTVFVVLILATLLAIPFLFLFKSEWQKILLSYAVGTSLHELIFNWLEDKFNPKPKE